MKILFIDHHDSFSNNIINFFRSKNCQVDVCLYSNLSKIQINKISQYCFIILSPGPGKPDDYPETIQFYCSYLKNKPVLGICLGHQIMLHASGGKIVQVYDKPIHGKQIHINIKIDSRILGKQKVIGTAVLYHSLGCFIHDKAFAKWNILLANNGVCLMAEHMIKRHLGIQFHPESFATTCGNVLLNSVIRAFSK